MNTTTIKIRLSRPDGAPVIGGQVVAQLEGVGISDLDGLISQARMEAVTDETGQASLALWPSANGVSGVEYRIVARSDDGRKVIDEMVNVIESAEPVRLTDILMVPPPSPKPYDEAAIEAIRADRVLAQQAADTSTTNADQAAASAQAAATSETNAANSASAAASSATDAANSAASINAADIVHAPGSGLANEAGSAAFADTGDFDAAGAAAGAQDYSIQRANHTGTQTLSTISDAGTAAGADVEAFDPAGRAVAVAPTAFAKADGSQPAWTALTATTLQTATDLALVVDSTLVEIAAGTAITLPAFAAGTDYTIYAAADGTLQAVGADSAAPSNTRAVGGFHASAGGASIVATSLWDLNWRPAAPSPRGMVLSLDGRIWADIYLMDTAYGINGYSRNGAQIADAESPPIIPDAYGGNGSNAYANLSWWVAVDLATAAGKRLPHYQEFTAFAYGVVERQAVGTDPGTTQHQAGHRSACGVEQVTGVMWQWGADITGTSATGAAAWNDWTDGRGYIYTHSICSPQFGADWHVGAGGGSRASFWRWRPDASSSHIGARGVCDHLNLQAER